MPLLTPALLIALFSAPAPTFVDEAHTTCSEYAKRQEDKKQRLNDARRNLQAAEEALVDMQTRHPSLTTAREVRKARDIHQQAIAAEKDARDAWKIDILPEAERLACARYNSVNTALGATETGGVATDLLKTMGEVVLDKATQAAWELLREQLLDLTRCGVDRRDAVQRRCSRAEPLLKRTHAALDGSRLQDLLAQPDVLLNAVVSDWLTHVTGAAKSTTLLGEIIARVSARDLLDAWRINGRKGLENAARVAFGTALRTAAAEVACPATLPEKALWLACRCMADGGPSTPEASSNPYEANGGAPASNPNPAGVAHCPLLQKWATEDCQLGDDVINVLIAHADVLADLKAKNTRDKINLVFELALLDAQNDAIKARRLSLQSIVIGALDDDWTRVTLGAVSLIEQIIPPDTSFGSNDTTVQPPRTELTAMKKLLSFLAGVGRYTASYKEKDAAAAAKARKDALADLASRMTDRSQRTRGWVFSIGGSFGVVGGVRQEIGEGRAKDFAPASPFHLGLGLGLDSHHGFKRWRDFGVHAEVSFLDLGQYVAFERRQLQLKDPELTAALAPSAKLGVRIALRQTPLFLGGFFALNPFLRAERTDPATMAPTTGGMTLTYGLMLGVYVPFLDFN